MIVICFFVLLFFFHKVMFYFREALEKLSDMFRDTVGNFYINDKSTGSVVGQQPFGGSRLSGNLFFFQIK